MTRFAWTIASILESVNLMPFAASFEGSMKEPTAKKWILAVVVLLTLLLLTFIGIFLYLVLVPNTQQIVPFSQSRNLTVTPLQRVVQKSATNGKITPQTVLVPALEAIHIDYELQDVE